MSQSASEHAVHFVTPPLRSGRPYENPALPELPNLWSLDHPDTAPIPDEAACRALWTRYAMFSHIERHSECVAGMAEALARRAVETGATRHPELVALSLAAGLLHDIGKALDHEMEGSHIALGVEFARKYKESEAVVHAIEAHHGDVECKTVVACLVQAADAVSASRPGARRENVENYIKRLQQLEEISCSFEGVERAYAIQAGREVRVMVKPEVVSDSRMPFVAHEIAKKIESEMEYPGQIKVNIIRESRASDVAK